MKYTGRITETKANGSAISYKVTESGTAYHEGTPDKVVEILERARENRQRLKIYYGDHTTGRDWLEEMDKYCYIGRSTGSIKIPLVIANSRSHGGCGLLDHCIVKIKDSNYKQGRILYQSERYQAPTFEIVPVNDPELILKGYTTAVKANGETYSNHKTEAAARRLIAKLS